MSCINEDNFTTLAVLYQGDTKDISVTATDDSGNPVDITGDSITLKVQEDLNSTTTLHTETQTTGDFTTPLNGETTFTILPAVTETFPARDIILSVVWTDASTAKIKTLLYAIQPVIRQL